jgi:hypothetical protein
MVKAAGIAAGTLLIAIGLAAQLGGADVFGTARFARPVSQTQSTHRPSRPSPSPSAEPSKPPVAAPATTPVSSQPSGGGEDSDGGD